VVDVGDNGDISDALVHVHEAGLVGKRGPTCAAEAPNARPKAELHAIGKRLLELCNFEKIRPRDLAVPGPNLGVGVRHSLFPGGTRLDALAFAGGVLPDATLRGMRMFRSHGGTVLTVAGRDFFE
jgi:hypothetical protein